MQLKLALKLVVLGALTMAFLVSFVAIGAIRGERERRRDEVVRDIAQSTAGAQTMAGPLLVLPFQQRIETRRIENGKETVEQHVAAATVVLVPESLAVTADAAIESRQRGIHRARIFTSSQQVRAVFRVAPVSERAAGRDVVSWGPPRLAFAVSDPRGLRRTPRVRVNGQPVTPEPGTGLDGGAEGFQTPLASALPATGSVLEVAIDLDVVGTEGLQWLPVGRDTRIALRSPWPHPSFGGRFLPDTRTVGAGGFTAEWQLSHFATGIEAWLGSGAVLSRFGPAITVANRSGGGRHDPGGAPAFGVTFVEPVDVYRLTDRAVKYGMLFVVLTFTAFFLFEVLRGLAVHPVQYALVGGALAVFFLLLLSLAEHVPFALAYVAAAIACVGLIAYYVTHVLGSFRRAAALAAGLAVMYAFLYVVLQSEDYALLLGTLVVFGVLAVVMVATRRVNWYRVGEGGAERRAE